MTFHVPEQYRLTNGSLASDESYGNNGAFILPPMIANRHLFVIASDGAGFEHVSVSCSAPVKGTKLWIPTWVEMCHIKDLFWDPEDCVVQYHPPKSEYVNCHKGTLHLWRPIGVEIPRPPAWMVGPRGVALHAE